MSRQCRFYSTFHACNFFRKVVRLVPPLKFLLLERFFESDESSEKQNVSTQVVVRSKSHGVTREGKLIQPSAKMERGPPDWGAEMV